MRDLSEDYSLLAIQGPKAVEAMQALSSVDLSAIKFYHFEIGDFAGIDHVIISATGYTGSGGFEIYCKNKEVKQIWNKVLEAGASFNIKPIGLAARDTLRLDTLDYHELEASINSLSLALAENGNELLNISRV